MARKKSNKRIQKILASALAASSLLVPVAAFATNYSIDGGATYNSGVATGGDTPQMIIKDDGATTQASGTWNKDAGDTVNMTGGTLSVSGYDGSTDALTNGIITATGGTLNITGGQFDTTGNSISGVILTNAGTITGTDTIGVAGASSNTGLISSTINVATGATFTTAGVDNTTTPTSGMAGGIILQDGSTLNLNGGTVVSMIAKTSSGVGGNINITDDTTMNAVSMYASNLAVSSGKTLTNNKDIYLSGSSVSGNIVNNDDISIRTGGAVTSTATITGSGNTTVAIANTVLTNSGSITGNDITIDAGAKLITAANTITDKDGTVVNNGTLELNGGTSATATVTGANATSGSGKIIIDGFVNQTGALNTTNTDGDAIKVNSGKYLKINANNLGGITRNDGTVALTGGTVNKNINYSGSTSHYAGKIDLLADSSVADGKSIVAETIDLNSNSLTLGADSVLKMANISDGSVLGDATSEVILGFGSGNSDASSVTFDVGGLSIFGSGIVTVDASNITTADNKVFVYDDATATLIGSSNANEYYKDGSATNASVIIAESMTNTGAFTTSDLTINQKDASSNDITFTTNAANLATTNAVDNHGKLILTGAGTTGQLGAGITDSQSTKTGTVEIGTAAGGTWVRTNGEGTGTGAKHHDITQTAITVASGASAANIFGITAGDTVTAPITVGDKAVIDNYGDIIGNVTLSAAGSNLFINDAATITGDVEGNGGIIGVYAATSDALLSQISGDLTGTYEVRAASSGTNTATIDKAISGATGVEVTSGSNAKITDTAYTSTTAGIEADANSTVTLDNTTSGSATVGSTIGTGTAGYTYDLNIVNSNATAGTTVIGAAVTGAGDVNVKSGTVQFDADVTSANLTVNNGATLQTDASHLVTTNDVDNHGKLVLTGAGTTGRLGTGITETGTPKTGTVEIGTSAGGTYVKTYGNNITQTAVTVAQGISSDWNEFEITTGDTVTAPITAQQYASIDNYGNIIGNITLQTADSHLYINDAATVTGDVSSTAGKIGVWASGADASLSQISGDLSGTYKISTASTGSNTAIIDKAISGASEILTLGNSNVKITDVAYNGITAPITAGNGSTLTLDNTTSGSKTVGSTISASGTDTYDLNIVNSNATAGTTVIGADITGVKAIEIVSGTADHQADVTTTNAAGDANGTYTVDAGAAAVLTSGTLTADVENSGKFKLNGGNLVGKYSQDSTAEFEIAGGSSYTTVDGTDLTTGKITLGDSTTTGTLNVAGGAVTLGSDDVWTVNGTVNQTAGVLNLAGVDQEGTLSATGGTLNITDDQTLGANATVNGAIVTIAANKTLTLNTGSDVTLDGGADLSKVDWKGDVQLEGGSLTLANIVDTSRDAGGNKSGKLVANSGNLTINNTNVLLGDNDVIAAAVNLNLTGDITVTSGADATIDSSDTWTTGNITQTPDGVLTLDGVSTAAGKSLDSTGGTLNVENAVGLTVNTDVIAADTTLNIKTGATLTNEAGDITINAGDSWVGDVSNEGGKVTISGRDDSTSDTVGKFNQTSGDLKLDNTKLTLNAGSAITGGTIDIDPSELVFNNGVDNSAVVTMADDGSKLTIEGIDSSNITTLNLNDGSNISKGTVTVGDGTNANVLTLAGATVIGPDVTFVSKAKSKTSVEDTSSLTLNAADTWNGEIDEVAGSLLITGRDDTTSDDKLLVQTGGDLTLDNTKLTLKGNSSVINAALQNSATLAYDNATNNTAVITTDDSNNTLIVGDANVTSLTLDTGSDISSASQVKIGDKGTLNSNGDIVKAPVTNDGVYNLTDGVIAESIKDTAENGSKGELNLIGTTTSDANGVIIQKNVKVDDGAFTMGADVTAATLLEITDDGSIANAASAIVAGTLNNDGSISGNGDLTINNGGYSKGTGSIVQGNIDITDGSFDNDVDMTANTKLSVGTNASLDNSADVQANQLDNDGTILGDGNLKVTNGGSSDGSIAQATVELTAGNFDNNANITTTGNFINGSALDNDADITVGGQMTNTNAITSTNGTGNLKVANGGSSSAAITQATIELTGGNFDNDADMTANTKLAIGSGATLDNDAKVTAKALNNDGIISGTGDLEVGTDGGYSKGAIEQATVNLTGGSFDNDADITTTGTFTNAATLNNDAAATITSGGLLTNTGLFTNDGTVIAQSLDNDNAIDGTGDFTVTSGGTNDATIEQATVTLTGGSFDNNKNIATTGDFTNGSALDNDADIDVGGQFINTGVITTENDTGTITVAGGGSSDASITQKDMTLNGTTLFDNNADITLSDTLTNAAPLDNDANIITDKLVNSGVVTTENNTGNLTVQNGGSSTADITQKDITLNGGSFNNTAIMTSTGVFTNHATVTGDTGTLNVVDGSSDNTITQATIKVTGDFDNDADMEAKTLLDVESTATLDNDANITAAKLENDGIIKQTAGTGNLYISGAGSYNSNSITQDNVEVKAGDFTNQAGADLMAVTKLTNDSGATLTNEGRVGTSGTPVPTIQNDGTFINETSGEVYATLLDNNNDMTNKNSIIAATVENDGAYKNDGVSSSLLATTINNNAGGTFENDGKVGTTTNPVTTITNNGTSFTNNGTGTVVANTVNNNTNMENKNGGDISSVDFTNAAGAQLTNNGTVGSTGTFTNAAGATVDNNGTEGEGVLNVVDGSNAGTITQGDLTIAAGNTGFDNTSTINTEHILTNGGTLNDNGGTINAVNSTNDSLFDNEGTFNANNSNTNADNVVNNGTANLTASNFIVSYQAGDIEGTINIKGTTPADETNLDVQGTQPDITGNVNVGSATDKATLNLKAGNIKEEAQLKIASNSVLNVDNSASPTAPTSVVVDGANDDYSGDITLKSGDVTMKDIKVATGAASTTAGGTKPYYEQTGGNLKLENSTFTMADASKISGGNMNVDDTSVFNSQKNAFNVDTLQNSGLVNAMNGGYEHYGMNNLVVGSATDKQGNFTADLYARSNLLKQNDSFGSASTVISAGNGSKTGTVHVSDWTLHGDLMGADAPVDKEIYFNNMFAGKINSGDKINFTATDKKVFTPIGNYRLSHVGGGTFKLELVDYNPQVYRGQVTKLAQYENQLAIDDMLFTHSMVLPSFKEENGNMSTSMMANRYAGANDLYAPYEYSRKDGGVWFKGYGTFEHLDMKNGLDVGNNAYGSLIGADFGLKQLSHGWKFMPTAYVGYNGAHQYFNRVSAYQNGGQAGFMGTWYKDNFLLGALVYGGAYNNHMTIHNFSNEDSFGYFAGTALKGAYNWRVHKDFVIQPNLLTSYNYFGQENWHTDFGQMSMMSGMLNGVNIAPGVNFIWEKDTFNAYLTVQYMFNVNQSIGGKAGNVYLPRMSMDHGYIQYGIGASKKFTDRFSGYVQAVVRNAGRTGIGIQAGFEISLGRK